MAKKTDTPSDGLGTDDDEGWLSGIVADEDDLDRPSLWRLGAWGVGAVGAMIIGLMAVQLPVNAQRTQLAAGDIASHTQKVERAINENSLEARRLAAAVETLSGDRDRAFTRLSALEQGLEGVTGSISKMDERPAPAVWPNTAAPILESLPAVAAAPQTAAAVPAAAPARPEATLAPAVERVEVVAAIEPQTNAIPAKPPSVIEAKPIPEAQAATETNARTPVSAPVQDDALAARADFGVDLGSAHSMDGLRALWRGVSSAHKTQLEGLRPVIAVQERKNGLGVQLRLIAGPIKDAATASRICAALSDADRDCKTAAFEGQRLSLPNKPAEAAPAPAPRKPRRQSAARTPPPVPPPASAQLAAPTAEPSTLASLLRFR